MKLTKNTLKRLIKEEVMQEESGNMVYIVLYSPDRIPENEAVFSTKEKAEAYIQEEVQDPQRSAKDYDFEIETYEIDRYA